MGHASLVRQLIATALYKRMVPADRVHLFDHTKPADYGILEVLGHIAALPLDLTGEIQGREVYKVARSVCSFIFIDVARRLEVSSKIGTLGSDDMNRLIGSLKLARLLLTIDRKRNWFPQLTVERTCAALRNLTRSCKGDTRVIPITAELLSDFSAWLRVKPRKETL